MNAETNITHSGFVSLIGRPNVGKSTLLNLALGEKLVITSPKPQTTRNRITGVLNRGNCQLVFFDTPGVHDSPKLINQYMAKEALGTLSEVEAAIFLVDAKTGPTPGDRAIADKLRDVGTPVLLAVNKRDAGKHRLADFADLGEFQGAYEISAINGKGVEALLDGVVALMPEGPMYYPDDVYTDRPERFIAQEYIREKVFSLTGEEIPYSVAVTVDAWEDKPEQNLAVVHATIHVERKSQKGIIIGKGGALIKKIGRHAREDLEKLLGSRVYLDLHVGIEHNWTKDERQLKRFGYTNE